MILTIDMGNSNIVIGGIDDSQTYFVERVTTNRGKTDLEYAVNIKSILEIHNVPVSSIEGAILSSVVPPLNNTILSAVEKICGFRPMLVGSGMKTGLNIIMDNPKTVGSDMIVDAVAAIRDYPCPIIIIDMGTATTMSVIDRSGNYIGGVILARLKGISGFFKRQNCPASLHQPGNSGQSHRQEHHRLYALRYYVRQRSYVRWPHRPDGGRDWRKSHHHRHRRTRQTGHSTLPSQH